MDSEYVKSILKSGTNSAQLSLKAAKFDELNILATFHPADKDYGHMVIDEPKTPFVFEDDLPKELDANTLIEKLRHTSNWEMPAFGIEGDSDDSSADEDFPESLEEKARRMEFEKRRKQHYKEFFSVPLARRLIAEEFVYSTTSEYSFHSEKVTKAEEVCCENTPEVEASNFTPFRSSYSASQYDEKTSENIELEPGFSPSHHCYQKLQAEIYNPPEDLASLSHLQKLPSVNGEEVIPDVRVPNTSLNLSVRTTLQDGTTPLKSSLKSEEARICKSGTETLAQPKKK
ncbi:protein phosphatase inhibitor 2 family member C [Drosophila eugracilis]|uniref:protein phosphatase inhibitor 2 family member C n=1 Tax=Drosophila eugracilis TaxID=29029 RepID=UPI0007E66331|nr:protein phosphatase inhibitor 2 family member C [Drosophila eugracilis]